MLSTLTVIAALAASDAATTIAERNAANPYATYSVNALSAQNVGGCYHGKAPSPQALAEDKQHHQFTFTDAELAAAADVEPAVDVDA